MSQHQFEELVIWIPGKGVAENPSPPLKPFVIEYAEDIRRYYDRVKSFLQQHHFTGSLLKRSLREFIYQHHEYAFKNLFIVIQKDYTKIWPLYEQSVRTLINRSPMKNKRSDYYYLQREYFKTSRLKQIKKLEPFLYWSITTSTFEKVFLKNPNLSDLEHWLKFLADIFDIEDIIKYEIVESRQLFDEKVGHLSINVSVIDIIQRLHKILNISAPLIYERYTAPPEKRHNENKRVNSLTERIGNLIL